MLNTCDYDINGISLVLSPRIRIMKRLFKSVLTLSVSALVFAPALLPAGKASAQTVPQPTGTNATYLGGGISAGVTNGGSAKYDDSAKFGGNVSGRFAIPNTAVSARGSLLFGGDTVAIVPTITYDVPVTNNSNIYLGAGYSFIGKEGDSTPLGNKDSVVLTVGVESQVNKNVVLFSDGKLGIDAYKDSSAPAASIQAGAAYRFN